jgi:hypothetical protein
MYRLLECESELAKNCAYVVIIASADNFSIFKVTLSIVAIMTSLCDVNLRLIYLNTLVLAAVVRFKESEQKLDRFGNRNLH